jgi:hypothetical protein
MGRPDPAYCDLVVRWTVSAVREALRALRPARLSFGVAQTGIGMNRRELRQGASVIGSNPGGAYDPGVYVLRVEEEGGRPVACWFSHGTHPVVMGNRNTGLSAEWPGSAASTLARTLECPALFAQGCCGDINPVRRGEHEAVRSVGRELAGAALIAWERAEPVETGSAGGALETLRLPQYRPSIEEARAALEDARAKAEAAPPMDEVTARRQVVPAMVAWAEDYLAAAGGPEAPHAPMDVQALRIGDVAIVATGAETFVEIGQEIVRRSPFPRTVALGYSNGCIGYLPTEKAFPLGGYEVNTAYKYYGTLMVTPDCERLTLEAAKRVLDRVGL